MSPIRLNTPTPTHICPDNSLQVIDISTSPTHSDIGLCTPPAHTFTPTPPLSRHSSRALLADEGGNSAMGGLSGGEGELGVLLRTVDFAARKHSCQRRKDVDQTPYINHPIAVANYLATTGITDVRVLQAAILHDTVEDTHTSIEEIAEQFGSDVARIVEECTDDIDLSGLERKAEQLRSAPGKSNEAKQVKLADKMHNLESIRRSPPVGWGVKRVQAYFIWAKKVTDICAPAHPPLAARLDRLYSTAYTRVNGVYHPCHPETCGPLTEEEKERVDRRLRDLKDGDTICPEPLFF
ncbi:hypothetical protein L202_04792 [Cryptococcus amylolentus CBS 6039]|uniref:Guanosine-3',5'-bis(diphosphate) 3'-pyrophosphohydrolase MESH1 n=2 Tax=Cryptococcus amylolentus TaxID=104669 RepID=A0A1E3HMT3_9TREE|nr:hypothetical protein L202_04792 [Cryptococcus amylolentus CBS 6039]ODN77634.1 hypothetical protein L202_04792 [Cryptococcus amylolentus CBS 6039]ODO05659.1 hypothetical protein I350_04718 [Cryptococcus amylolentus CBS 6273]